MGFRRCSHFRAVRTVRILARVCLALALLLFLRFFCQISLALLERVIGFCHQVPFSGNPCMPRLYGTALGILKVLSPNSWLEYPSKTASAACRLPGRAISARRATRESWTFPCRARTRLATPAVLPCTNRRALADLIDFPVLRNKGTCSALERERECDPRFIQPNRQHSPVEPAINALGVDGCDRCRQAAHTSGVLAPLG